MRLNLGMDGSKSYFAKTSEVAGSLSCAICRRTRNASEKRSCLVTQHMLLHNIWRVKGNGRYRPEAKAYQVDDRMCQLASCEEERLDWPRVIRRPSSIGNPA